MRDIDNLKDLIMLKPDMIGLIFYEKSPRFVCKLKQITEIRSQLGNIKLVGVFVNEKKERILQLNNLLHFNLIQLHGTESPDLCHSLQSHNLKIIKAFGISDKHDFDQIDPYRGCIDYALFDTKSKNHGGTGMKFNWNILEKYTGVTPFFLSGGIEPNDFPIIHHPQFIGIDLNSRFEISAGVKDIKLLSAFFNKIRK